MARAPDDPTISNAHDAPAKGSLDHSPAETQAAMVALSLALRVTGEAVAELCARADRAPNWADVGRLAPLSRSGRTGVASLDRLRAAAADAVERGRRAGMRCVPCTAAGFPPMLRHLRDPPLVLWTSGREDALDAPAVAIVGARAASTAAVEMARRLGRDLAAAGLVVVSGLARGVDGAAHEGALEGGLTVAVLGSGLDVVYPPEHGGLAARVSRCGLLVSEFPAGTPPRASHFPRRNRIVAGLSLGVVVVEAGERSGALITAREALDQGKEVMVVPGLALAGRNRGGHGLIKDGAALVEHAADVLDVLAASLRGCRPPGLGGDRVKAVAAAAAIPVPEEGVFPLDWRVGEELDLDEITRVARVEPSRLLGRLLEWELAGSVARTPSGRFVRLSR
jgi:DNA processing protein